jgi:hypothetical protein
MSDIELMAIEEDEELFLNLDEMAAPTKKIRFEGKDYTIKAPAMDAFLSMTILMRKMKEAKSEDEKVDSIKLLIDQIKVLAPDLPDEILKRMDMEKQAPALLGFLAGGKKTDPNSQAATPIKGRQGK